MRPLAWGNPDAEGRVVVTQGSGRREGRWFLMGTEFWSEATMESSGIDVVMV